MFEIELNPNPKAFTVEIEREFEGEVERIIRDTVHQMPVQMRELMSASPPTGKRYRQSAGEGFQRFHAASSKGNPPRHQSFAASKSFKARMIDKRTGEVTMNWYIAYHDENGRPIIERAFTESFERAL